MPKILAILAVLTIAAFFSLPANAAAQSKGGAETDHSATMMTDISAHRRRYRYRPYPYYNWGPRPYYGYGYGYVRPYPYRYRYWEPTIFPYGPWW